MCGITGFIDTRGKSTDNHLRRMVASFKHRGPDDDGQLFESHNNSQIGLGHVRLSIIDLSACGHQPMHFKKLSIVFNGEIYNFKEIKQELVELGHQFVSEADTEVVLHAFDQWGKACVSKFIGMFAFSIYDREQNKLILCRDRAGVKPLYYYWNKGTFLFGSELKTFHEHPAFEKQIDLDSLGLYFRYGYVPSPYCIFKNCFKLDPGHWLIFDLKQNTFKLEKYWALLDTYKRPKLSISYPDAVDSLEQLLISACNYRMVADVPVGVFLSGGYDSTAVASILQCNRSEKIKTFTIGFEDAKYNEAPYAKDISNYLGTDHTEYYCKDKEAKEIIPNLTFYYDEPFADSSAIPTTLVSQLAKKKVSVALSADAGDEVFFGYQKDYRIAHLYKILSIVPKSFRNRLFGILKTTCHIGADLSSKLKNLSVLFGELRESTDLLNPLMKGFGYFTRPNFLKQSLSCIPLNAKCSFDLSLDLHHIDYILAIDYLTCLSDDMLVKVDRATMSCSLEGREPLLDHRLAEFASQLPTNYKFDGKIMKKILKDVVYKYVPKNMMDRPKSGFGIPIFDWLRDDLSFYLEEYCNPEKLKASPYFNEPVVTKAIEQFKEGSFMQRTFIWQLLVFQMWNERWMK